MHEKSTARSRQQIPESAAPVRQQPRAHNLHSCQPCHEQVPPLAVGEVQQISVPNTCPQHFSPLNPEQALPLVQVKNRESAARSRQRKQAYTSELEEKVEQLQQQNADLLQKVGNLVSSWPWRVVRRGDLRQQHAGQLQVVGDVWCSLGSCPGGHQGSPAAECRPAPRGDGECLQFQAMSCGLVGQHRSGCTECDVLQTTSAQEWVLGCPAFR